MDKDIQTIISYNMLTVVTNSVGIKIISVQFNSFFGLSKSRTWHNYTGQRKILYLK